MTESYLAEADLSVRQQTHHSVVLTKGSISLKNARHSFSKASKRLTATATTGKGSTPEPSPSSPIEPITIKLSGQVNPQRTRHNGLLTPFCRRQISFMRNYKYGSRPGPLKQLDPVFPMDQLEEQQQSNRSKCLEQQNSFRSTITSCFLKRLRSQRKHSRQPKENSLNERLTLQPKPYKLTQKPTKAKFFSDERVPQEERQNSFTVKEQSAGSASFIVKKHRNMPISDIRCLAKSRRRSHAQVLQQNETLEPWRSDDMHPY